MTYAARQLFALALGIAFVAGIGACPTAFEEARIAASDDGGGDAPDDGAGSRS